MFSIIILNYYLNLFIFMIHSYYYYYFSKNPNSEIELQLEVEVQLNFSQPLRRRPIGRSIELLRKGEKYK